MSVEAIFKRYRTLTTIADHPKPRILTAGTSDELRRGATCIASSSSTTNSAASATSNALQIGRGGSG
jgi:hypothetical protein